MALWGLIVAAILAIGFLLLFVGLAVVVPILAHSSWHLYRRGCGLGRPCLMPGQSLREMARIATAPLPCDHAQAGGGGMRSVCPG